MADALTIDVSGFEKIANKFENMSAKMAIEVDKVLNATALEIAAKAKRLAPADRGFIRQGISTNTTQFLRKEVNALAFYSAYMEFGTGAYAAQYVASLPPNWQGYAREFKGKSGGTFAEMLRSLREWVRRKGIASGDDINSTAYLIARKIIIAGVKPHPFMFPAYQKQQKQFYKDLENVLKELSE